MPTPLVTHARPLPRQMCKVLSYGVFRRQVVTRVANVSIEGEESLLCFPSVDKQVLWSSSPLTTLQVLARVGTPKSPEFDASNV